MSNEPTAHPERLKMLQDVVNRLAGESANVKTWAAAIFTGLAIMARISKNPSDLRVGLAPLIALAMLDAYYLGLEREYRRHYERTANISTWSVRASDENRWKRFAVCVFDGFRSPVIIVFYGALLIAFWFVSSLSLV